MFTIAVKQYFVRSNWKHHEIGSSFVYEENCEQNQNSLYIK